ncbi:MAG TPA: hypothetical protein IAC02_12080 [Candidatus Coprovivens excrementavium]|nr:hypothetical protein [Candidatus Coprovivens excrementavium]
MKGNEIMDIQEKLKLIQYCGYKYKGKKWNANETKDFFDLAFSQLLFENTFNITNSQQELLSYFDFQEIFNNFENGMTDVQSYLLKFMAIKGVKGLDLLLQNMPYNLEEQIFYQLYVDLKSKDNRPFWLSRIIFCIKNQNKIQFINNIINIADDNEILFLIKDLYENKNDNTLTDLLNNERFANIATEKISAPFFYEMVDDLHLSNDFVIKRENELKNIIINYQDYNINDVKNAYCDLYFHDIPKNVSLDIKTIIDFANDDPAFKNEYIGELYDILCNIYAFLNNDIEYSNTTNLLLNNGQLNHEILSKCYLMCQKRFKELVSQSVNKNITENIEPKTLLSSSGNEVKFYNIENQTEIQKHVTMLVSTIPCSEDAIEFKQIYYSDKNGEIKNGRRSCSLVNETKLSSLFGGKNRITFGYDDLNGRIITSATLGDGGTDGNEERFRRHRKVRKSSYLSVDKFVACTQGHTEVTVNMGTTGEVMKPGYILITRDTPTQFEIDVAAEFGIPIRYVNISKYEQQPDISYSPEDYDYYSFERKTITGGKRDIKTI